MQAISIPQFKNLTLTNAKIAPPPFDVFKFRGGICVFQVFDNFAMANSQIDLTDAGIPTTKKNTYKPLTEQEYFETDGSRRAGEENFITAERFILNSGDGAAMIMAKNFSCDDFSRIGNPATHGRANCRGAADSPFKPSNVTNIGGSTILIAAENLQIQPENLAKYRSADSAAGKGLARCYIAANTILADDEKLYAFDILADEKRVQNLGVENFGSGTLDFVNPKFQLNNFAKITHTLGDKIYFSDKTLNGYEKFQKYVLIRSADGVFKFAEILASGDDFIIADAPANPAEIISIPEFANLTLENYTADKFFGAAVSGTFTLTGEISVANALELSCGNSQSFNKVSGIFILAKKIIFGENARLNAGAMIICNEIENFSENIFTGKPNFIFC